MTRVPPLVQGIARTAIYRLAVEKGHSVITSDLLDEAMDRYMPKGAKAATKLAESRHARARRRSARSRSAGSAASRRSRPKPVVCSVCGGNDLPGRCRPRWSRRSSRCEGGGEEESTYDGRKLTWTRDAKRGLWTIQDGYKRRRTKARIEKAARLRRLDDRQPRVRAGDHRGGDRHAARAAADGGRRAPPSSSATARS